MIRRILILFFCLAAAGFVLVVYNESEILPDPLLVEYYLKHFQEETFAQNAVAAIYLNYRMFDSIFETLILLVSVTAVINFSWRQDHEK